MEDKLTYLRILGALMTKPSLFLDEQYKVDIDDFHERFHQLIFATMKNLIADGCESISPIDIDAYLAQYPTHYQVYNDNKGFEYCNECLNYADVHNFKYHYNRFKKDSLVRYLKNCGIDTSEIYNDGLLSASEKEQMIADYERKTIDDILDWLDTKTVDIRTKYQQDDIPRAQAGQNLRELVESFKHTPEMGLPFQSPILNTLLRGARLKKFYLRSLYTGGGKTRLAVGDACGFAIKQKYENGRWTENGFSEPTLFITTELEIDEIQTLPLAYITDIEEHKILDGNYTPEEIERIEQGIKYIENAPLYIVQMPNFTIDSLETLIKEYKLKHKIKYVCFDYLHTSISMLMNASAKSGVRLREDNILFIFAERLKNLCNKLNVFITSSTQLNDSWKDAKDADMNMLRGMVKSATKYLILLSKGFSFVY